LRSNRTQVNCLPAAFAFRQIYLRIETMMHRICNALLFFFPLAVAGSLTGCGGGALAPSSTAAVSASSATISGTVFGGQQPIGGAHVYLYGIKSTIVGHNPAGVARSLLDGTELESAGSADAAGYGKDSAGNYYVITAADGSFSFNSLAGGGAYGCQGDEIVYAVAVGGNPGLTPVGSNSAIALMAVVATSCPTSALPSTLNVHINEASTVAVAYALSGYMSPMTTASPAISVAVSNDNSTLAQTGLINAGNNAAQLVTLSTGVGRSTTPTGGGAAPLAKLNTISNMLAACVNTASPTSTACGTLFANATLDGTSSGTKPTDTLLAALNIAHHPAANLANLFALSTPTSPFQPSLSTANDLTLSITYPAGGLQYPGIPAVDASGNVWFPSQILIPNPANPTLAPVSPAIEVSPLGAYMNVAFLPGLSLQAAVSPLDNTPWFALRHSGTVAHVAANGTISNFPFNATGTDDGHQIALDQNGNVYLLDYTDQSPYKLSNAGAVLNHLTVADPEGALSMFDVQRFVEADASLTQLHVRFDSNLQNDTGACQNFCVYSGPGAPTSVAATSAGIVWAIHNNTLFGMNAVESDGEHPGGGIPGSPFTGGGLNAGTSAQQPVVWLAIDGAGSPWVPNFAGNSISEFSSTGTAVSPSTGFLPSSGTCPASGLAVDGSGDVWVSCASSTAPVVEFIGAATPVYTPLTPGFLGTKP
jgi:hypothetical protein